MYQGVGTAFVRGVGLDSIFTALNGAGRKTLYVEIVIVNVMEGPDLLSNRRYGPYPEGDSGQMIGDEKNARGVKSPKQN